MCIKKIRKPCLVVYSNQKCKHVTQIQNAIRTHFESNYKWIRYIHSCNNREYVLRRYVNHAWSCIRIESTNMLHKFKMSPERVRNIKCIENIREPCPVVFSNRNINESEMYIIAIVMNMYYKYTYTVPSCIFESKYKWIRNIHACNNREYVLRRYVNQAWSCIRIKSTNRLHKFKMPA